MSTILDHFRLKDEKEDFQFVFAEIEKGVVFRGTNLWILVFAIFIASLGLNVNSTAVIIGAMLVSPLMGPIMGLGLGLSINDLDLFRKALRNFLFATGTALVTSTFYFLISPLSDAHSELLARTAPNIYDVLIALMGGFAGIVAVASKKKGNVIPGVAIATALMPPLCTAGYGLATWQFKFFFGALYLFFINTVFIAVATSVTSRLFNFPVTHLSDKAADRKRNIAVWIIVLATLIPSIYLGYNLVRENRFQHLANLFIENEGNFPNNYLLKKEISYKNKSITLTYGGEYIQPVEVNFLKTRLQRYGLGSTQLNIRQGFSYSKLEKNPEQTNPLQAELNEKKFHLQQLQERIDSAAALRNLAGQLFRELKIQYPDLTSLSLDNNAFFSDTGRLQTLTALADVRGNLPAAEREKMEAWLKVRLRTNKLRLVLVQP